MYISFLEQERRYWVVSSLQFSPLTDWVVGGDKRDDSAETFFQSLVQEALVSSSGTGRYVHSLKCWMDSIKEWTGQSTLDNHIVTELMNKDSKHSRQFTFN